MGIILLTPVDGSVLLRHADDVFSVALRASDVQAGDDVTAISTLNRWIAKYERAVQSNMEPVLLDIGAEMFEWIDQDGALSAWKGASERVLNIVAHGDQEGGLADALLAAPWELLSMGETFLAAEQEPFVVVRSCVPPSENLLPQHRDLALLFMAAAPEGNDLLDFEQEEASILAATTPKFGGKPRADVQVEESGTLAFLAERLTFDGPFEALHISCHGNIVTGEDLKPEPVLLLESAEGDIDSVSPSRLLDAIPYKDMPPLVFLSACRTAEQGKDADRSSRDAYRSMQHSTIQGETVGPLNGRSNVTPDLADPYVRQLSYGVANVLGWDGSVFDIDATDFAEVFYGEIARGLTVPFAAAQARRTVLQSRVEDSSRGRHWHLARVYLGPGGGGPLCDPKKFVRKASARGEMAFLDKNDRMVPVAGPSEFVGRRREIQRVLRAYRDGYCGTILHGMGNLGKSSLAARVAGRLRTHRTTVVFGEVTVRKVLDALLRAGKQISADLEFSAAEELRRDLAAIEQLLDCDPLRFGHIVRSLLNRCFDRYQPVLLVLDDFEQSLMSPERGVEALVPAPTFRAAVAALLHAFAETNTASRLLITTRYDFAVPDGAGMDLSAGLMRVPLTPMKNRERIKQFQATARTTEKESLVGGAMDLVHKALATARGNPGLQDALTRPVLAGERAQAEAAITIIEAFHESGEVPPDGEDVGDFFQRMAFETYTGALNRLERRVLGAATLFSEGLPVPRAALAAVAFARSVVDPNPPIDRLIALGLLDDFGKLSGWPRMDTVPHLAANPLARSLGDRLEDSERSKLAAAALQELSKAWRNREEDFPRDLRGVEAAVLALQADQVDPTLLNQSAEAAVIFLFDFQQDVRNAFALGKATLARLDAVDAEPSSILAGKLVNVAEQLGEVGLQEQLLGAALRRDDLSDEDRGQFLGKRADRELRRGDISEAEASLKEALSYKRLAGDQRQIAITMGKLADIFTLRGDLDGALRIRTEEQLPAFEALGDRREVAITKGKIADILATRGDIDGAMSIREEILHVYEALGDLRQAAFTKGRIADVLSLRGDLDSALMIREQEELPVYEAVGDLRLVAQTKGKIADALAMRGDLSSALRIREEEQLPVYHSIGDTRSIAITMGSIANIYEAQGEYSRAMDIRVNEALPVLERIGDVHSIAILKGQVADILQLQGDLDEALEIRMNEELPALEKLGAVREAAIAKGGIAGILMKQKKYDYAITINEDRMSVAREIGDLDTTCHALIQLAYSRLNRSSKGDSIKIIFDEIQEAFDLAKRLQRPDFIVESGHLLAKLLIEQDMPAEAESVSAEVRAAEERIVDNPATHDVILAQDYSHALPAMVFATEGLQKAHRV